MDFHVILKDILIKIGRELQIQPEDAAEIPIPTDPVPGIDQAFVTALKTGDPSHILCDYREGLKSAAACIAANESAESDKPVTCWNG